ncbi:hypothetical protein [Alkalinema sp. FACHB-956]|uniref:hypothetical protein n=1 Tax=Alkalinema sp. FACHB-956 TaxID=2692768 RepID=UPI001682AF4B|nr:hypothetical protein [Alkalinema sp. FACHB-956]MBD2325811.1 hypothetical protein [Alkalinema sp. FACHB-956]
MKILLDMASEIEQQLHPSIIGSLTVGGSKVLVGAAHGALVTVLDKPATIARRRLPYFSLPPPSSLGGLNLSLSNRQWVDEVIHTIVQRQSVVLSLTDWDQLSAFLRNLAHHPSITTSHPDGLIYISQSMTVADCLQELVTLVAYSCPTTRLRPRQLQEVLGSLECLIFLEASFWTPEDLRSMQSHLPACTIVAGVTDLGEGQSAFSTIGWRTMTPGDLVASDSHGKGSPSYEQGIEQQVRAEIEHHFGSSQVLLKMVRRLITAGPNLSVIQQFLKQSDPKFSLLEHVLAPLGTPERWILAVLLALGPSVSLAAEQIAKITGPLNPEPMLQSLLDRDLVVRWGDRYAASAGVAEVLGRNFKAQPWMKRVLDHVLPWAEAHQQDVDGIGQELPLLLYSLKWAVGEGLWSEVLRLARSLDHTLVLAARWDCWRQVLQFALQAAQQLEDRSAEAWAWHQLGTRALCEEAIPTAYDALSRSAQLRKTLPDPLALAVTQHNLNYLLQSTLPKKATEPGDPIAVQQPVDRRRMYLILGLICFATFGLSVGIGLAVQWVLQPDAPPLSVPRDDEP